MSDNRFISCRNKDVFGCNNIISEINKICFEIKWITFLKKGKLCSSSMNSGKDDYLLVVNF